MRSRQAGPPISTTIEATADPVRSPEVVLARRVRSSSMSSLFAHLLHWSSGAGAILRPQARFLLQEMPRESTRSSPTEGARVTGWSSRDRELEKCGQLRLLNKGKGQGTRQEELRFPGSADAASLSSSLLVPCPLSLVPALYQWGLLYVVSATRDRKRRRERW